MGPAGDLTDPLLLSLLGAGLLAAFLHAVLPTHWLPFVLVGRAQAWGLPRVLAASAAAAGAHIATTTLAGLLLLGVGLMVETWVRGVLPYVSAALLVGLGGWYLLRSWRLGPVAGVGAAPVQARITRPDRAAFLGLVAILAVSPGEALLPFYLSGAPFGWTGLALLSGVFLAGTLAGMWLITTVAWRGSALFRLQRLARYEGAVLGLALMALGVFVVLNPA